MFTTEKGKKGLLKCLNKNTIAKTKEKEMLKVLDRYGFWGFESRKDCLSKLGLIPFYRRTTSGKFKFIGHCNFLNFANCEWAYKNIWKTTDMAIEKVEKVFSIVDIAGWNINDKYDKGNKLMKHKRYFIETKKDFEIFIRNLGNHFDREDLNYKEPSILDELNNVIKEMFK